MVLKAWMSTANKKLDILQYLTEEDMQNIGNIRTKVEHVLVSCRSLIFMSIIKSVIFY